MNYLVEFCLPGGWQWPVSQVRDGNHSNGMVFAPGMPLTGIPASCRDAEEFQEGNSDF